MRKLFRLIHPRKATSIKAKVENLLHVCFLYFFILDIIGLEYHSGQQKIGYYLSVCQLLGSQYFLLKG